MSSGVEVTPEQAWDKWKKFLLPYFQTCKFENIESVVHNIIHAHASNKSKGFQLELSTLLISQARKIIDRDGIYYREYLENPNYLIYNDGRVYSLYINAFMSMSSISGYNSLVVHNRGVSKNVRIHRLVAIYFVNNPEPQRLDVVNHKDGNKLNNHYSNLEWVTKRGNSEHAVLNKLYKPYVRSVTQMDLEYNVVNTFESIVQASQYTGISSEAIGKCCSGRSSYTKAPVEFYRWAYAEERTKIDPPKDARPIIDFSNYLVTSTGLIYSYYKRGYLTTYIATDGYHKVLLQEENQVKCFSIHRLVAQAYLESDPKRRIVNHKDSDPGNNNISNLEYVTSRENSAHSYDMGNSSHRRKIVKMIDPINRSVIRQFPSTVEASSVTKISGSHISACCYNKRRSAGGYLWQFEEEVGIRELRPKITRACRVEQIDLQTNQVLQVFSSMAEAAMLTGSQCEAISAVCNGRRNKHMGWGWRKSN